MLYSFSEKSKSGLPRVVSKGDFVLRGAVTLTTDTHSRHTLKVDTYAYLPPNYDHIIEYDASATILVFERSYQSCINVRRTPLKYHVPELIVNSTDLQPLLETPGEVFELRKLIPTSLAYDFDIHIMDFQLGEFLNVKEVHYNQHGLLPLEGQGIYCLGDKWCSVQAGDVIWMAPFVPQWYAALGKLGQGTFCTRT